MDLILDTSIIIEIIGGNERVREHLKNLGNKVFGITSVTEFELFCGYIFKDLKKAGKIPKIKDLLIAATCIANNKKLITGDGDFEAFRKYGLEVEII